jgi:hypothetical protein
MTRLAWFVGIAFSIAVIAMVVVGVALAVWAMVTQDRPQFLGDF